jgi:citrate lyase beta subunit
LRHFHQLPAAARERLFAQEPEDFDRTSDTATLAMSLGASLYMPATRPALEADLLRQHAAGVLSSVLCLEDAIADAELPWAEENLVSQLRRLGSHGGGAGAPLTFVRVRTAEQIPDLVERLGADAALLTGFVLPKFEAENGRGFFEALHAARDRSGVPLLAMPVLESPRLIHRESRLATLTGIAQLLAEQRDVVLAVRIGATDLSAVYGLRRDPDLTIYDIRIVAELISDVVNVLGRADGTGHVICGPVWEYFAAHDRLFKPQLRVTPFVDQDERALRQRLVRADLDGLIREVVLDKANGLTGKTVIHPAHVAAVHALLVVTAEEHADALDVVGSAATGGASASRYGNKMNESKPHQAWATRVLARARAFGVAREDVGLVDLLAAESGADRAG